MLDSKRGSQEFDREMTVSSSLSTLYPFAVHSTYLRTQTITGSVVLLWIFCHYSAIKSLLLTVSQLIMVVSTHFSFVRVGYTSLSFFHKTPSIW